MGRNGFGPTPRGSRTWRAMDSAPSRGATTIQRNGFGPISRSHNDSAEWVRFHFAQPQRFTGMDPTPWWDSQTLTGWVRPHVAGLFFNIANLLHYVTHDPGRVDLLYKLLCALVLFFAWLGIGP